MQFMCCFNYLPCFKGVIWFFLRICLRNGDKNMGENEIVCNANETYLNGEYGYDMVVAVTQRSLNARLKQYLDYKQGEIFICAYNSKKEYIDYKSVMKKVNDAIKEKYYSNDPSYIEIKLDLFEINVDSPSEIEKYAIEIAKEYGLTYATKAQLGRPNNVKKSKMPDLIKLRTDDNDGKSLYYNAYYAEFDVLVIDDTGSSMQHISQPQDEYWVFTYLVRLTHVTKSYKDLPVDVQNSISEKYSEIENFDSIFSIESLYFDLRKATIAKRPEKITNVNTKKIVEDLFVDCYIRAVDKMGGVVLGYALKENVLCSGKSTSKKSFGITDCDYMISYYGDPEKSDLDTLNYLFMFDNNSMPAKRKPFPWNWVEPDSFGQIKIDGVMAIRRENIFSIIQQKYMPFINNLYFEHHIRPLPVVNSGIDLGLSCSCFNEWKCSYQPCDCRLFCNPKNSCSSYNANGMDVEFRGELRSTITVEGNKVKCKTDLAEHLRINISKMPPLLPCGSSSSGDIFRHTIGCDFTIGVDDKGQIFIPLIEFSDYDDGGIFRKDSHVDLFINDLDENISDVCRFVSSQIDLAFKLFENTTVQNMNGFGGNWFFPGGDTFCFKSVSFSRYNDLTVGLTYSAFKNKKEN